MKEYRVRGGREGEVEWLVGWRERWVWKGEGGGEWDDVNGQMDESREMSGPGL